MTHRFVRVALSALVLALAACEKNPVAPHTPARLDKTSSPSATVPMGAPAGTFAVRVLDGSGSPVAGITVDFAVTSGVGTVSPTRAVTDVNGDAATAVVAGDAAGQVIVTATINGSALRADASVIVTSSGSAACFTPTLGLASSYQGISGACFTGGASGSEFVMIAFNTSSDMTASTSIGGIGLGTPPAAARLSPSAALLARGTTGASQALAPDVAQHYRLLERSRALAPRFGGARRWQASRRGATQGAGLSAQSSVPVYSPIGTNPQVGQVVNINVEADFTCTNPDYRPARIMAVSARAVVMADTTNPAGGFTTADYQRFAARFDTLVYPLDVTNFGTPSDIDKNGRVGILFTRGVNEMTPRNSGSFVGGFFYSRDLFPRDSTADFGAGCAGSNEGELFYMLAPDPTGIAYEGSTGTPSSSNVRRTGFVDSLTTSTIAHEFQHLINASRRIYVNTGAEDYETVWLNEGLSHIAEELLYYRQSGYLPRQNLNNTKIRIEGAATYPLWRDDMGQNFQRFSSYLRDPEIYSPTVDDDALAIRGATWSFLRYAADQAYAADGDLWFKLANSTQTGFATLRLGFPENAVTLLRDWSVANYIDDSGFSAEPRYFHKSWNYRSIYTETFTAGVFPLKVNSLTDASVPLSVVRNSASYFRFSVPAGVDGRVLLNGHTTSGANFQFVIIRTK